MEFKQAKALTVCVMPWHEMEVVGAVTKALSEYNCTLSNIELEGTKLVHNIDNQGAAGYILIEYFVDRCKEEGCAKYTDMVLRNCTDALSWIDAPVSSEEAHDLAVEDYHKRFWSYEQLHTESVSAE